MSAERHCPHCGYWYPLDAWDEDENELLRFGHAQPLVLRTVQCPGCRAILDAHAPELRSRQ